MRIEELSIDALLAQQDAGDDEHAYELTDREALQFALDFASGRRAKELRLVLEDRRLVGDEIAAAREAIEELLRRNDEEGFQDPNDAFYGRQALEVLERWAY